MPAYIIAFVDVTDSVRYAEYMKITPALVAQFGGKFIARGGKTETLEGPCENRRVVLLEFPSFEHANDFYHSAQYVQAKQMRAGAATATFILVDGWTPPKPV
ncbi:MAG: DUF1330 domain-containing protein [Phycisphaerae bacterium]